MMKMPALGRSLMLAAALQTAAAPSPAAEPLHVATASYPLSYFAQRIAANLAEVEYLVPADADPASWTPDETAMLRFLAADLILLSGAGYEKWAETASLPLSRIVDTTRSLSDEFIHSGEVVTHTHGPAGEHSHESLASMTWLDLHLAAAQASSVSAALAARLPERAEIFRSNLAALTAELEALDRELATFAVRAGNPPLLASHPVYQYFGRRYGFALASVHWEPGEAPPEAEWQELEIRAAQTGARWMLWEAPPLPEVNARLAQLGIEPIVFRTLERSPGQGDFMSVMRANIDTLEQIAK